MMKNGRKSGRLFCANCRKPLGTSSNIFYKTEILLQEIVTEQINGRKRGVVGNPGAKLQVTRTVKIQDALSAIYNLGHLLPRPPNCSDEPPELSSDDEDDLHDFQNIVLCHPCGDSLTTLCNSFTQFNKLRKINSFLDQQIRDLPRRNDVILGKESPQKNCESKSVQTDSKEIDQLSGIGGGPWVRLERLNLQTVSNKKADNFTEKRKPAHFEVIKQSDNVVQLPVSVNHKPKIQLVDDSREKRTAAKEAADTNKSDSVVQIQVDHGPEIESVDDLIEKRHPAQAAAVANKNDHVVPMEVDDEPEVESIIDDSTEKRNHAQTQVADNSDNVNHIEEDAEQTIESDRAHGMNSTEMQNLAQLAELACESDNFIEIQVDHEPEIELIDDTAKKQNPAQVEVARKSDNVVQIQVDHIAAVESVAAHSTNSTEMPYSDHSEMAKKSDHVVQLQEDHEPETESSDDDDPEIIFENLNPNTSDSDFDSDDYPDSLSSDDDDPMDNHDEPNNEDSRVLIETNQNHSNNEDSHLVNEMNQDEPNNKDSQSPSEENEAIEVTVIISYPCTECNSIFWSKPTLRQHLASHRGPNFFDCLHCDEIFRDLTAFQAHVSTHKKEEKERNCHVCVTCKKIYASSDWLQKHIEQAHPPNQQMDTSSLAKCFKCDLPITGQCSFQVQTMEASTGQQTTVKVCQPCLRLHESGIQVEGENGPAFLCGICDARFEDLVSFREHNKTHAMTVLIQAPILQPPRKFTTEVSCKICGKTYTGRYNIRYHERTHWQYKCKKCTQNFQSPYDLEIHLPKCKGLEQFGCEICGKIFPKQDNLRWHKKTHWQYQCKKCTQNFKSPYDLEIHLPRCEGREEFGCEICGRIYPNKHALQRHKKTHWQYKCTECRRRFQSPYDLEIHLPKCKGREEFGCEICGKTYPQKEYLRCHQKTHWQYKCEKCRRLFRSSDDLETHLPNCEGRKVRPKPSFSCPTCNRRFQTQASLERHLLTHDPDYPQSVDDSLMICTKCGKTFTSKRSLVRHEANHVGTKEFECSHCFKKYSTREYMLRHIQNYHCGDKSSQCDECGKTFTTTRYLKWHKMRHTGDKRIICQLCPRAFYTRRQRWEHQHVHTGIKPYKCHLCGMGLTQKGALVTHIKTHMREDARHSCQVCGLRFYYKRRLKVHMKTHDPPDPDPSLNEKDKEEDKEEEEEEEDDEVVEEDQEEDDEEEEEVEEEEEEMDEEDEVEDDDDDSN